MSEIGKRGPKKAEAIVTTELCAYGCGQTALFKAYSGKMQCAAYHNACPQRKLDVSAGQVNAYKTSDRVRGFSTDARAKSSITNRELATKRTKWLMEEAPWDEVSVKRRKERVILEQGGLCKLCSIPQEWNGNPLTFQLDHIDGDNSNNARSNVRAICPNCHSQTPTWGFKKRIALVAELADAHG